MLEHAWLQCSCFLNFPMIQISPIHSNGQLHPPWRHTNQEDNYTLCWYVFKAGELNHWKIQKNMNTLLCSGLKVSARSLAWLPSLFNLKSTSKLWGLLADSLLMRGVPPLRLAFGDIYIHILLDISSKMLGMCKCICAYKFVHMQFISPSSFVVLHTWLSCPHCVFCTDGGRRWWQRYT